MTVVCSRSGCASRAVAQLMYDYADSRVDIVPVSDDLRSQAMVLCQTHLDKLTVPKGWVMSRRGAPLGVSLSAGEVDALADAVRRVGGVGGDVDADGTEHTLSGRLDLVTLTHKAHLRVVADASLYDAAQVG